VSNRDSVVRRYEQYLEAGNRRSWEELGLATTATFPDYRWELRRVVLEGDWLAVHLRDTGTRVGGFLGARGDGARVETDEFDMYRVIDGLIVELEGTADNARLCR
jgi:predicted ester cyclase